MAQRSSPTIRLRELGARLRELRTGRGLTVEQVAAELMVSAAKVSRLETGNRGVNPRDIRDLARLYDLPQSELDHLLELAKESKQDSWWQKYDLSYSTYVGLEQAAATISDYESSLIPGLLQTADYSGAIIRGGPENVAERDVELMVEARQRRQELLTVEEPPIYHAVFDEAAVRRQVGGPAVMKAQLNSLVTWAEQPNVTIQLIPFEAGAHPGLDSTFVILGFEQDVSDVVYIEGLVGSIYQQGSADLARYRAVFATLRAVALSPADTTKHLKKLAAKAPR